MGTSRDSAWTDAAKTGIGMLFLRALVQQVLFVSASGRREPITAPIEVSVPF
jgi:hypothetical protein